MPDGGVLEIQKIQKGRKADSMVQARLCNKPDKRFHNKNVQPCPKVSSFLPRPGAPQSRGPNETLAAGKFNVAQVKPAVGHANSIANFELSCHLMCIL